MRITEFQNLIKNLYFQQDNKRGVKATFIWLIEEIGELASIINAPKFDKERASEELADVIAWLNSLANLLEIDIEDALLKKYPNMCIKCKSNPCVCGK